MKRPRSITITITVLYSFADYRVPLYIYICHPFYTLVAWRGSLKVAHVKVANLSAWFPFFESLFTLFFFFRLSVCKLFLGSRSSLFTLLLSSFRYPVEVLV